MNPYSAPTGSLVAEQTDTLAACLPTAKTIFLQWEKLRIVYIAVLAGVSMLLAGPQGLNKPDVIRILVEGAVIANVLYFAGPVIETYVAWLGFRPCWLRWLLFGGGTLLSILLAIASLFGLMFPNPD
jgi:hypothetical protein